MGRLAHLVKQVLLVWWVNLALEVTKVTKVIVVMVEKTVLKVPRVQKVLLERLVSAENPAVEEKMVNAVHKVHLEVLDPWANEDLWVHVVHAVNLEIRDQWE